MPGMMKGGGFLVAILFAVFVLFTVIGAELCMGIANPPPAEARTLGTGLRLEIIGEEDLYVTSKTSPVQLASAVSPMACAADFFFEGEAVRWRAYADGTSETGALIDPDVLPKMSMDEPELDGTRFILDESAAVTGTSVYVIYYGRP